MAAISEILTIDAGKQVPFMPGDHFIELEWQCGAADIVDRRFQGPLRTGRQLLARLDDDLWLAINDNLWSAARPCEIAYRGDGFYSLSLRLSGNCVESVNSNDYPLGAFTCSMVRYAPGVRNVFSLAADEPLTEVCVVFSLNWVMKKYGLTGVDAEALLNPSPHRKLDPWFNQCRMNAEIERVVHDLRGAQPTGRSWRLYLEAKALELLSLYLAQLESRQQRAAGLAMDGVDLQRLHAAREYLGRNFRHSPRIEDLCRLVGLSRKKLMSGFKSEFKRTVFEYLQYARMEQAKALFQNGFTDVKRVARRVGYSHQGNFSKAFKRYTGVCPRQFVTARIE